MQSPPKPLRGSRAADDERYHYSIPIILRHKSIYRMGVIR